ncbi:MAG: hypothetical protein ACLP8A_14470 [Methylovirgula sp.]
MALDAGANAGLGKRSLRRLAWLSAGAILGITLVGPVGDAAATAQDGGKKLILATDPPLPPSRPNDLTRAPATAAAHPVPVPASPATPPGVDPMVTNFSPDMPQELPAASRAQMHKCGSEWQKMKQTGAATDKTWLTFARICLAR